MASLLQCFKKSREYTQASITETNQELEQYRTEDRKEIVNAAHKILFLTIKFKDDAKYPTELGTLLKTLRSNQEKLKYILHFYVSTFQINHKDDTKEVVEIDDSVLGHVLENYEADVGKIFVDNITDKEIYTFMGYKDPKKEESLGYCPLACAAVNDSSEMINLLVENNVITEKNVNIRSDYDNTLLHFACRWAPVETVRLLLSIGANYKSANKDNRLPIHDAAGSGNVEKMKVIFNLYANDDIENKYGVRIDNKIKELKKSYAEKYNISKKNTQENPQDKNILEDEQPFQEKNGEIIFIKGKTDWDTKFKDEAKLRVQHDLQKKFGEECFKERDVHGNVAILLAARYFRKFNKDENRFNAIKWILDNQMEADATAKDEDCDTMFHFISTFANPDELQISLKANCLLGAKNEVGNAPLDWIDPDTMHQMLDNNLKKLEIKQAKTSTEVKDEYKIIFKNTFGHHASGSDIKNIVALAQSERHQELALHPVCQSILSIKWQKMKKYFYLKLLFFIPLVVMLSFYPIILNDYSTAVNETKTKLEIEVLITWYTIYVLLLIQVIFGTISILVLIPPFWKETKPFLINFNKRRFYRLLEFYWDQLVWSDWYEYVLWVVAFLHLHGIISAVPLVLVSWFSLFLVLSNHPSILPFKYILVKILFRYLKFFIFAFGLISGFAMGFYLVLRDCKEENNAPCAQGAFTSIYSTALKIPAMMMGEISFENFSLDHPYVYFLFGSFIFLVTCCLFNMMNGLAINITQELMQKAHIFKTIAECDMIFESEVLLKEISSWIAWFNLPYISFLSPLHVERIKASPNSGLCENLDEISDEEIEKQNDPHSVFWFSSKDIKNWQWHNRGYVLDRKLIANSNAIISKAEQDLEHLADEDIDGLIKCIKDRKKAADIKYSEEKEEQEYSNFTHGEDETDDKHKPKEGEPDKPTGKVGSPSGDVQDLPV